MSDEIKNRVENLLKKNPNGLTITEISKLLKLTRNTVAIALAELKGAQQITIRKIGMAKLHYWGGKK